MAVPKKKNSKIKYRYSILKKNFLNKLIIGIFTCKICKKELKFVWKKKICFNCIKKLKNINE